MDDKKFIEELKERFQSIIDDFPNEVALRAYCRVTINEIEKHQEE